MPASTSTRTGDLVPVADRVRALSVFRTVAVLGIAVFALWSPESWSLSRGVVVTVGVVYWAVATTVGWAYVRAGRRGVPVIGLLLLLDAAGLHAVAYATGALASPVRYLILCQLVVVALVASYRTGLKLAIWQSLLLLLVHEAMVTQVIPDLRPADSPAGPGALVLAVWLVTLAASTASAVNERELRRRRYESEALAQMGADLQAATAPDTVAHVVAHTAANVLDLSAVAVVDTRDTPVVLASAGEVAEPATSPGGRVLDRVITGGQPVLVAELVPDDDRWLAELLPGARNIALLPLSNGEDTIGVLALAHGLRAGSRIEQRVLSTAERIADHAALSLENAWLTARLARHALVDPLTGVANRRVFDDALATALGGEGTVALLMLDLDHFKQVNDKHGHAVGDVVLEEFGVILRDHTPDGGVAARLGGEEFALLWPGAEMGQVLLLAEEIRVAVMHAAMPVPVTTSVGACVASTRTAAGSSLLRAADLALYDAKRDGRNQVRVRNAVDAASTEPVSRAKPARTAETRPAGGGGLATIDAQGADRRTDNPTKDRAAAAPDTRGR